MRTHAFLLLPLASCTLVEIDHTAVLPANDLSSAVVSIERGSFSWLGSPDTEAVDLDVYSWASGANTRRAAAHEATNEWGALIEDGVGQFWGASPSRRAGVDLVGFGPDRVDFDVLTPDGAVWLEAVHGTHIVTAAAITAVEVSGSVDLFATSGPIEASLRPSAGDVVQVVAARSDVLLYLPANLPYDIEVTADPSFGMEVADLVFDTYYATPGTFTAQRGDGSITIRVTVDHGAFLMRELVTP